MDIGTAIIEPLLINNLTSRSEARDRSPTSCGEWDFRLTWSRCRWDRWQHKERETSPIDRIALRSCEGSDTAFLIGYVLIFTFGVYLGSMPVSGLPGFDSGVWEVLRHVLLPVTMMRRGSI